MLDFAPLWEAPLLLVTVIALTRLIGLRSFSKMSAYDFAITVAFGSTLAAVVLSPSYSLGDGMLAFAVLFVTQWLVGEARIRWDAVEDAADNTPLLLMREGEVLHENLRAARVTEADLMGKLREANALRLADVHAVVFETTGDISVLHGEGPVDDALLAGVRG